MTPWDSPAQEPLRGVFESDECTNDYPVAGPFLDFSLIQRTLPECFEGPVRRQEKSKPSAIRVAWVSACIELEGKKRNSRKETRDEKHEHA